MGQGENTHVKAKLTERDEHEVSLLYTIYKQPTSFGEISFTPFITKSQEENIYLIVNNKASLNVATESWVLVLIWLNQYDDFLFTIWILRTIFTNNTFQCSNVCTAEKRTKRSSNILVRLVRNLKIKEVNINFYP